VALERAFGAERVACVGGPAHAKEMVESGAGLVCASHSRPLAKRVADLFHKAGVMCEASDDPVGVELAGCAKNAAVLAASAAAATAGPNVAGAAAGKVFSEIAQLAQRRGGDPETFAGLAGAGDLVATVVADGSRNRRAGELLAQGLSADEIARVLGQAAESVDSVALLAAMLERAGVQAPATTGLAALVEGRIAPEQWTESVTKPSVRPRAAKAA
jgi:glycerol-3-phosphate dehydrogenase (NAD(P)+)